MAQFRTRAFMIGAAVVLVLGAGGPLAGHVLQCVASLVSHGAQIVSIVQSHPFVLV